MCISGSKKCSFFGKFGMLCFLETTILRLPFLPNYRQYQMFVAILATTLPIFCGTFPNRINEANYYKKLHFTILEKKTTSKTERNCISQAKGTNLFMFLSSKYCDTLYLSHRIQNIMGLHELRDH